MEIISLKFAILVIASVIIFYLLNHKFRIGYLTLLSCGFIASFSYYLLIYILVFSLINYYLGIKILINKGMQRKLRTWLHRAAGF